MKKIRVGVVGATGYTGEVLLELLLKHPHVDLRLATSETFSGKRIAQVFPQFKGRSDLVLQALDDARVAASCSVVFSCLPHKTAMGHVPHWLNSDLKVVDLSADFRLRSVKDYEAWYQPHAAPDAVGQSVYGLPECHREEIRKARLVGNPGCYPTGALLGLIPLLKKRIILPEGIVIDAKSGFTGAGRKAVVESLAAEAAQSVHAYQVEGHRHIPEIEQELSLVAGEQLTVCFVPHLMPMERGILSTLYARPRAPIKTASVLEALALHYRDEPFVRVLPAGTFPRTKEVTGTNLCLIGAHSDPRSGQVVVITAIDNLMKGASGQAVQNMNLMCQFEETAGLH